MEVGFLQETKSILKSLVLSCPNGMTVDRLNRDYKEVVGTWIPYHKLGFPSLEHFLKSVTDTLVVTGNGREARVGFVSNEKLQHMNDMVSRQKNTTRERKVAVLHAPSSKSRVENVRIVGNVPAAPAPASTYCTFNRRPLNNNNSLYICPVQSYGPQVHFIPQQAQVVGNYLFERPKTRIVPLQKPHNNHFIPVTNTQFKGKTEFENSKNSRVFYQKDNNKNVLDKQNNPNSVLDGRNGLKNSPVEPGNTKSVHVERSSSGRMLSEPNSLKAPNGTSKTTSDQQDKNLSGQSSVPDQQKVAKNVLEDIKFPNKENPGQQNRSERVSDQSIVPRKTTYGNNNLESSRSNTFTNVLSQQTKSESTADQYKSNSVLDKQNLPRSSSNGQTQKPVIKPVQPEINFSLGKESSEITFKRPALPPTTESKNSSFNSNVVKKINTDPFSQIDSSDNDIDEAVPEFAANNLVFRVDFPENTVAFGKKIPNYELPKDLAKGSVVGVFISEIHSPFKFWFHIYKDNHELDILMNRIECFYGRLYGSDLVIPKTSLAPGQVCAALFNEMWHRAEILTNVSNNKVKVHFVDYGTVSEIEIQNIKYLPTIFANTPTQAIRGSLSHIKPISPLWPKRAIREFLSMVSEVLLYGQIIEIDEKEKTVYMVLCDTNSGETVQINKQLVDRGFAKLDSEWDENKIAKNGYRKRHPREIFPTFEMLETGEYPSLSELEQLLAQGIDYEKITEKIILSNLNNNVCDESVLREDCLTRKNTLSFNLLDTNPFKSDIISEIVSLKIFDD